MCPLCNSEYAERLGTLGAIAWFRCRHCGIDYNVPAGSVATLCDCCGIECDAADAWTDGVWTFCGSLYGNGCDQTEPALVTEGSC